MSLLLAVVPASGGVSGTATTSQSQTIAATGAVTAPVSGTATTSQAQTAAAAGTVTAPAVTGTATTSQAQTAAATGAATAPVSGTASTSQAQTAAGTGNFTMIGVVGDAVTSQAQTASASGTVTAPAVTGVGSTSQAQTTVGIGTVSGGEPVTPPQIYNLPGYRRVKRTPEELEAFYRSIGALPEIQTPTSVVSENKTQYAPIEEIRAVDSTKRYIEAFEAILDRIAKDSAMARYELAKQEKQRIQREIEEADIAYVASVLAMSD